MSRLIYQRIDFGLVFARIVEIAQSVAGRKHDSLEATPATFRCQLLTRRAQLFSQRGCADLTGRFKRGDYRTYLAHDRGLRRRFPARRGKPRLQCVEQPVIVACQAAAAAVLGERGTHPIDVRLLDNLA